MKNFFLLVLICLTLACATSEKKSMFTNQQLGQLLVVGFRGTEIDKNHQIIKDLKELHIGGVILYDYDHKLDSFGRNIESPDQMLMMASTLISNAPIPPIISVEQDGSALAPLKERYGFPPSRTNDELSAMNNEDTTRFYARNMAQEFMVVGVNTTYNPILDLSTSSNPVDTWSENSEKVIRHSGYTLDEYDTEGIFSVPKYFPGYGSGWSVTDTVIDVSNEWTPEFLEPYKAVLKNRVTGGIMTAHSYNTQIDSVWPGTLSKKTIQGLLRDSLGFDGVVFSDDLQKPAITAHYDMETAIAQALNAGVDVLVFGNNFEYDEHLSKKVIDTIHKLIVEGIVTEQTIQNALNRVEKLKTDVIAELCTCLNL